jgi:hypothetical protein
MWLPSSVYERAPHAWLVLGLVFMSSGLYLGFSYSWPYFYFGVGIACCLFSMWIFTMRLRHRGGKTTGSSDPDEESHSTGA